MSYSVKTYEAFRANLAAANTAVMLCRANLSRITLTTEERTDIMWRIDRQRAELDAMALEMKRETDRRRDPAQQRSRNVVDFRAR